MPWLNPTGHSRNAVVPAKPENPYGDFVDPADMYDNLSRQMSNLVPNPDIYQEVQGKLNNIGQAGLAFDTVQQTVEAPPQAPIAVTVPVQAAAKPAPAGAPSKQQGPKKPSYEAQGIRALQEGLNAYFGTNALKVDGIMGPKTQAMLRGYEEDFANKAGLAGRQAPIEAVVSQQASVQQPSFLGMKLDQQATEAAWDKWRSNDAPEGYIPTAVYR